MKLNALILTIAMSSALTAGAQDGLNINSLFNGPYRDNVHATETVISGSGLWEYNLSVYHSLTLSGLPGEVSVFEAAVMKDAAGALDKEVAFRNGRLYYGYYTLKPVPDSELNRYLFYLNQHAVGKDKLILIYIEGRAGRTAVKRMLKK
ncbi:DUF6108 family protein [Muribaculum intestinale]|uniref:DUF6108 family protein n=1 Tax=Muribaculum intestinale TaxID=1796646 RepID=UPI0026081CBD|nr:DUF6108 family protein [Muribaculum intestinale]